MFVHAFADFETNVVPIWIAVSNGPEALGPYCTVPMVSAGGGGNGIVADYIFILQYPKIQI